MRRLSSRLREADRYLALKQRFEYAEVDAS